jgi:hypothetical protein
MTSFPNLTLPPPGPNIALYTNINPFLYNKEMLPTLPGVEKRLQDRYHILVQEHTGHAHPTGAGPRCLPTPAQAKAHAQAAWRFFHNRRLSLPKLMQPLLELARQEALAACLQYGLVIHDWSQLHYCSHTDKRDRIRLGKDAGLGYELYTALLLGDQRGQPVAPLRLRLRGQGGVRDSARLTVRPADVHLDRLTAVLRDLGALDLPRPLVHLVDAEGDSVYHLRQWQAAGHAFVVRTDDQRMVRHQNAEKPLPAVVEYLRQAGAFAYTREVSYQGRAAAQYVAEAAIVLARPAWLHRTVEGQRKRLVVPGDPLPLRLVVSEVRASDGTVLARWQLLSNVPAAVDAATVALWYYWRWQVESYFKLLKAAGQQVEQWQQEDAGALVRRLLVASMACALVWRLARSTAPAAPAARQLLQRLSGRQLAWGKDFTEEALLAGFWVLLAMVEVLKEHTPEDLKGTADFILAGSG